METGITEAQILLQVHDEVRERFMQVDDLAHGWEHVSRVYTLAQYIAEREGAKRFICAMAALMHDLGRAAVQDGTSHHADLSMTLATDILNRYQVAPQVQKDILHAIIAHSFSRGVEPETLEAGVVRDADRLDALGAIGIMRWAITATMRHTPETLSYHPEDPFGEEHALDDDRYMLDHFYAKLLKLGETMTTETGRVLAQRRVAFMRTYLYEFARELSPI
ncbi:MAG TPA: HD domain-containing protein [Ktedonobacteraceae bacterium]|nr:HD domain-containing protein [Ktedonobacteraceae bacterium]